MESNYSINSTILPAIILKNEETIFSFEVENVPVCEKIPLLATPEVILTDYICVNNKLEDFSHRQIDDRSFVVGLFPGLLLALHTAYESHYPLKLSVSDFVILIGQGLGRHMDRYSEELRQHFVNHEGKEEIIVFRDGFVLGEQNDWSTTFGDFAAEIKKRVKTDIYDIVVDDTSVATPNSRIVSEITLMDCMKSYFDYTLVTRCGIPQITLEGTSEDWKKLREKFRKIVEMNKDDCLKLDFWLKHLAPVLEEVCETGINRKANVNFWNSIYKYMGNRSSGTPHMSGWITVFFPYLAESKINSFSYPAMLYTSWVPKQMCEVPFIWDYLGTKIPMTFYGGFMGAHFDKDTFTVSPSHFWCVAYKNEKTKEEEEGEEDAE